MELTQLYDDIKKDLNSNLQSDKSSIHIPANNVNSPAMGRWKNKLNAECNKLQDACYKHFLVDIYCKILPLDSDYVNGNMGQMKSDIDSMLNNKDMTATQYLTSGYEKTNAPLLEFLLRSGNNIKKEFIKEAEETLKDAQENDLDVPLPEADEEDQNVQDQLVDVKSDMEYETFIDELKQKTIDKIVNDVTKIIDDSSEGDDMVFEPKTIAEQEEMMESTTSIGMNYLQYRLMKENVIINKDIQENMLGLAIRESTINQIDRIFKQSESSFREFASRIRFGKGILINESTQII